MLVSVNSKYYHFDQSRECFEYAAPWIPFWEDNLKKEVHSSVHRDPHLGD